MTEVEQKILALYNEYVREIHNVRDISRWSSKATITQAVMNNTRKQEADKRAAIEGSDYRQGDKVRLYFTQEGNLKLAERWTGDHDTSRLLKKLYDTACIFSTVLDVSLFPNFSLKRKNQETLANLLRAG